MANMNEVHKIAEGKNAPEKGDMERKDKQWQRL